jgi:hypothetical protein
MTAGFNSLDVWAGVRAYVEVADWVANYGATTWYGLGYANGIEFDNLRTVAKISADNAIMPVGGYYDGESVTLKASILQTNWLNYARLKGDADAKVTAVARVAGTTDGTLTYLADEPPAPRWLTVKLTAPNIAINPGIAPGTTDVYSSAVLTIPKCLVKITKGTAFGVKKVGEYGIEIDGFEDTSITAGSGQLFKWVATAPK